MIIVIYFIVGIIFGVMGAGMARRRNRDAAIWGIVCFLFPLIGIFVLAIAGQAAVSTQAIRASDGVNMRQWQALVELDPEIADAAMKARAAGPHVERMLAEKYLALNDKQYLGAALTKALEQGATAAPVGKVGKTNYKMNSDGTFVATSGRNVGRTFSSLAELEAACS